MSEETNETVEETAPEAAAEDTTAVAVEDAPAEEAVAEEAPAEEPVAEEPVAEVPAGPRQATVYLCERGHRTLILWGEAPATCNARPTRHGAACGRPIYHMTELPEQVQKALNPLKASKKKAGKK